MDKTMDLFVILGVMNIDKSALRNSFWSMEIADVFATLKTSEAGLTHFEVAERQKLFGRNTIETRRGISAFGIFFRQLLSPLILILIVAATITLFLEDYKDTAVIAAAVIANTLLGFYQEYKAEEAIQKLMSYVRHRVRVVREGQEREIDAEELAPGDFVVLYQGDRVPADLRIVYENEATADEALLTGESLPVEKDIHPVSLSAALGDRGSMLFAGTTLTQGVVRAVVCRTGADTEIGKIAALVAGHKDGATPLQDAIKAFSLRIAFFLFMLIAAVFALGLYRGTPFVDMFVMSVAMAVGAVPEGLPIALTVILAVGVERLSRRKGVVKKLLAAETLGSASVILVDKTGTLTEAHMTLSDAMPLSEKISERDLLSSAILNTHVIVENPDTRPEDWHMSGRALEAALLRGAALRGVRFANAIEGREIITEAPFNSKNKYSATLVRRGHAYEAVFLGAPEILLQHATRAGGKHITDAERSAIFERIKTEAYNGKRVLGVAIKHVRSTRINLLDESALHGTDIVGLVALRDPVRETVPAAFKKVTDFGVRTVMVTGDHKGTAEYIAREVGFEFGDEGVVEGRDLRALSAEELAKRLAFIKVVARVSPEDKTKIAKAFQEAGEVVAMTGDGVNDAPTLKQADIGIAMGSGTDVTKEVADLVILDDNFETIVAAIEEGRKIFGNIRKVVVYLLSSIFDELFLIGGALLAGLPIPLTAAQILWVNFFTDSFPAIALAFEDDRSDIGHRPKKIARAILDAEMKFLILVIGILTSALLFGLYWWFYERVDILELRTFIFAAFGLYSIFVVFSIRNLSRSIFSFSPLSNIYVVLSVLFGTMLMLLAIYAPPLQRFLGTVSLSASWLLGIVFVIIINIMAIEFGKYLYRQK